MSKHLQQLLVEHLQAIRALVVARATEISGKEHYTHIGLCVANYKVRGLWYRHADGAGDVQIETVQRMIEALPEYQAKGNADYMFPVYATEPGAQAGYERRLEILDGWIADTERKVRAAVFREAIRSATTYAGRTWFMCTDGIAAAAQIVTGAERRTGDAYLKCMATLQKYKPKNVGHDDAWFELTDATKRLRIAILNLCLTDVLRHGG